MILCGFCFCHLFIKRQIKILRLEGMMRMKDRNAEGYPDPTAARAIKAADWPPEEIIMFRKMIKALSVICHVRVLGKVTLVDKKGRRW